MLTYFPSPYPDEWWYSVLCRYHVRSGHSKYATTINELYSDRPMVHGRLIPGGDCAAILSNLPPGVLSIDDVLANYTLLPYYTLFLLQTRSSRYGRHYGLAVDQGLPACGHRCRMARRGSSTVPPVISWIQKNTESHFGTGYIKFPCSPFARCTKCRLLLCLPSLHGYRRCFSRSYLYATKKLNTEEKPHGWSR